MNEPTKEPVLNNEVRPSASNQRGFSVIELLFAASTIAATVVALAVTNPKIPKSAGD